MIQTTEAAERATAVVSFHVINHPTQLQMGLSVPLLTNQNNPCVLRSLAHTHAQQGKLSLFMQRLAFDLFRYHSSVITDISVQRNTLVVRHDGQLTARQVRRYIRDSAFQTGAVYAD